MNMPPEEMEKAWEDFLAWRKAEIPAADPDFTRRVMESVRAREAFRKAGASPRKIAAEGSPLQALAGIVRAWIRPYPIMAMASLLLAGTAILYTGREADPDMDLPDVTRIKGGGFDLAFALKRGNRIETAKSGDVFLPGDRLQAVYSSEVAGYLNLFSIDETGAVACLSCQGANPELPAGLRKTLPYALELDGSPRSEAMVGFWSPDPAIPAALEKNLRAAWEKSGRDLAGLQPILAEEIRGGGRVSVFRMYKRGKT
jgi:hypothetical protein